LDEKWSLLRLSTHPLGGLGATYTIHLQLIEKLFGLTSLFDVLIELFSLDVMSEALRANINWKSSFLKGWVSFGKIFT